MRHRQRIRALIVCAAVIGAGATAHATHADTPPGVVVNQQGDSHLRQQVAPLAGSRTRLVYAQIPVEGDGTVSVDSMKLEEYDGSGHPTSIGAGSIEDNYSLSGSSLTATSSSRYPPSVQWWNLANHTTGTSPTDGVWAGSAPNGWYYTDDHHVYDEATDGSVREVAKVFAHEKITNAAVGPHGVVVSGSSGDVSYVTSKGHVTRLKFNSSAARYEHYVACGGTSATRTVCAAEPILRVSDARPADRRHAPNLVVDRVPLAGGRGYRVSDVCAGNSDVTDDEDVPGYQGSGVSAAFTARQLVCADVLAASVGLSSRARSHESTYRVGSAYSQLGPTVVAALGRAVVANDTQTALEIISSAAAQPRVLLTPPRAKTSVGAISLSPGRVAWVGDPPATTHSAALRVYHAPIASSSTGLSVGSRTTVAHDVEWNDIWTSGTTTAYIQQQVVGGINKPALHVVSPYRDTVIVGVRPEDTSLSGNRLLYATANTPQHPRGRYMMLNVDTGKIMPLAEVNAVTDPEDQTPVLLWGSYVIYYDNLSTLDRLDLTSGKTTVVANADDPYGPVTWAYGPYVGWHADVSETQSAGAFKNVTADGPVVTLPDSSYIYAMTNSGIVYGFNPQGGLPQSPLYVRGYDTSDEGQELLTANNPTETQLDDGVLVWRDDSYQLRASAISVPSGITPLSLGAPYSPAFALGAGNWMPTVAFSASLSSCQFTISQAGKAVRTLACEASAMRLGDAVTTWNGQDVSGGAVPAGDYQWSVSVTGTSGSTSETHGVVHVMSGS